MVASVQLPTGDENDWLGTEPDIDEAAITETWDTDIVIVGAGNGGMCAAAYAAQNGLDFRLIEQNSSVMETRHWYGTIDSSEAQKKGIAPVDRAELLSEISRSMGGRCDQRVVKTWINESAAMHDFVSVILCERGIRTFEKYTRNTLDLSAVPLIHEKTHLPVILDPSHATGKANLVEPMMIAAVAAGADGLEVEVHYDPRHAWSDGAQCLTPDAFAQAMAKCRQVAWAIGRDM